MSVILARFFFGTLYEIVEAELFGNFLLRNESFFVLNKLFNYKTIKKLLKWQKK